MDKKEYENIFDPVKTHTGKIFSRKRRMILTRLRAPDGTVSSVASSLREAGSTAALIFFTVHQEQDVVTAALAAGALGYVTKQRMSMDLEHAIREARVRG